MNYKSIPAAKWNKEHLKARVVDLEATVKNLREDRHELLEDLKKARQELQDRKDRDRSPRRLSASMSHDQLSVACNALHQVALWERDSMLLERDAKIREQRKQIEGLRRGDGPIGEVMAHIWGSTASKETRARILSQTRPVNQTLEDMRRLSNGMRESLMWGGLSTIGAASVSTAATRLA